MRPSDNAAMDDLFNPRPVYPPLGIRTTPAGDVYIVDQDPPRLAKLLRGDGPYSWKEEMLQPAGQFDDLGDAGLAGSCEVVMDGTTASGSPAITGLADTTGLVRGQPVSGTGVPAGAVILSVDSSSQVTLTANATASGTVSLTFGLHAAAYERNGATGIPAGTFVLLWRGYLNTANGESQEWIFDRCCDGDVPDPLTVNDLTVNLTFVVPPRPALPSNPRPGQYVTLESCQSYIYKNPPPGGGGGGGWQQHSMKGDPSSLAPHNLLSTQHGDTVAFSPPAKGDLVAGNEDGLWQALGVGADGEVLTADSTAPRGVSWQAGGGGGGGDEDAPRQNLMLMGG